MLRNEILRRLTALSASKVRRYAANDCTAGGRDCRHEIGPA